MRSLDTDCQALVALGRMLQAQGYRFVAITPATHQLVLSRNGEAATLRDVFGWNRPFAPGLLDEAMIGALDAAGLLLDEGGQYRAGVRFASAGELLFAHSPFPTTAQDAVFFGPDTYRFLKLLERGLEGLGAGAPVILIDIGCGSGAGGLHAHRFLPQGSEIVLADINQKALAFAAANAALAGVAPVKTVVSDVLGGIEGAPDIVIANPPYLVDSEARLYRHGGGRFGTALAERIVSEALDRLRPGGRLILYTGTPIVGGTDPFFDAIQGHLQLQAGDSRYEEIDPDVFGEELERPAYAQADRIAVVGLIATKRG